MPELPDVTVYVEALAQRVQGATLDQVRFASPFVLRSVTPPISTAYGLRVLEVRRQGKRIVFALERHLFLVLHLMIAGRLRWEERGAKIPGKVGLAALDFSTGTLIFTEASTKKRAAIHLVAGDTALAELDRGGIEVIGTGVEKFKTALLSESHTLKRSLTDPRIFSGIGNAYSDEILHAAKLSPMKLTGSLSEEEIQRLYDATQSVLVGWTEKLREETGEGFPQKVTAFREGMAVHGRYGQPCPTCGGRVARIVYAENEANYCPRCQVGGRLLADRSLSRLLKDDWPKTVDELEQRIGVKEATKPAPPKRPKAKVTRD